MTRPAYGQHDAASLLIVGGLAAHAAGLIAVAWSGGRLAGWLFATAITAIIGAMLFTLLNSDTASPGGGVDGE